MIHNVIKHIFMTSRAPNIVLRPVVFWWWTWFLVHLGPSGLGFFPTLLIIYSTCAHEKIGLGAYFVNFFMKARERRCKMRQKYSFQGIHWLQVPEPGLCSTNGNTKFGWTLRANNFHYITLKIEYNVAEYVLQVFRARDQITQL